MLMELFCDWFEGQFNNRKQTYNNPREAQFVTARHERVSKYEFYCSYSYQKSRFPYRELDFAVQYHDGEIFLTDKITRSHLVFKHEGSTFTSYTEHRTDDRLYIYQAILGENFYEVNDRCYDSNGNLLRGLPDNSFFQFKKIV